MQVGGAVALSVLATFAAERTTAKLADGASQLEALNAGFHVAYLIAAGIVVLAIGAAALVIKDVSVPAPDGALDYANDGAAPVYAEA
jgi:hypothetical protein